MKHRRKKQLDLIKNQLFVFKGYKEASYALCKNEDYLNYGVLIVQILRNKLKKLFFLKIFIGQFFSQFNTKLVETENVPNNSLNKYFVFIKSD